MSESEYVCPMCGESFDSARGRGSHRRWNHTNPWEIEDKVREKYVEERMSIPEIADEWDCGETTIEQALDEHNIETRDRGENYGDEPWKDSEILEKLYWNDGLCYSEIAEKLGCSIDKVRYNMENENIPRRGDGGYETDKPWHDEKKLRDRIDSGDALDVIAEDWGCSPTTVYDRAKRYGIDGPYEWKRPNSSPYSMIVERVDGESHSLFIHQLVAYAHGELDFEDFFNPSIHVHHKNEIVWLNNIENLEVLHVSDHSRIHQEERLKNR